MADLNSARRNHRADALGLGLGGDVAGEHGLADIESVVRGV